MDHCVGGHTYNCVMRASHIFSLASRDKKEYTTLEIKESGETVRQIQIHGPHNGPAPGWAEKAADWLVEGINNKTIPINTEEIQQQRAKRDALKKEEVRQQVELAVGFNPYDIEKRENAYLSWHHEMPNLYPHATLDEFMEACGFKAILDEHMPAMQPV